MRAQPVCLLSQFFDPCDEFGIIVGGVFRPPFRKALNTNTSSDDLFYYFYMFCDVVYLYQCQIAFGIVEEHLNLGFILKGIGLRQLAIGVIAAGYDLRQTG